MSWSTSFAPWTTPPVGSNTVTLTVPCEPICAQDVEAPKLRTNTNAPNAHKDCFEINELFIIVYLPPLLGLKDPKTKDRSSDTICNVQAYSLRFGSSQALCATAYNPNNCLYSTGKCTH